MKRRTKFSGALDQTPKKLMSPLTKLPIFSTPFQALFPMNIDLKHFFKFDYVKLILWSILISVPWLWDSFTGYQLGQYLLYGIIGQGIALCWGKAGFLPLGQALFFGLGAYLSGGILIHFEQNLWLLFPLLLLGIFIPALIAWCLGVVIFKRQVGSSVYFSMITLALSMLGFQLANSLSWLTGGFNGLVGIPNLPYINSFEHLYYLIVFALIGTSCFLNYLFCTPFGQLLSGVEQNEKRLQAFGFQVNHLKSFAFAISAAIAGLAGVLYAPHQGIVTPQAVGFLFSAELLVWTAVGGRNGYIGAIIGAVFIGFLSSSLRDSFEYWEVVVALVFLTVVLKFPTGIAGQISSIRQTLFGRQTLATAHRRSKSLLLFKTPPQPHLHLSNVMVQCNSVQILNGLNLKITSKGIHCVIGPNGAGKTSMFNTLAGALPVSSGGVDWAGQSLIGISPNQASAFGIGRKFQIPMVFQKFSIAQNIDIALWSNRIDWIQQWSMSSYQWQSDLLKDFEEQFPFLKESEKIAGELSVGQRQILDLTMTFLSQPQLILLDEPCAGLSSSETAKVIEVLLKLKTKTQATIMIIEHDMQVVKQLADRVWVMNQGQLLVQGVMEEIQQNTEVQKIYTGVHH